MKAGYPTLSFQGIRYSKEVIPENTSFPGIASWLPRIGVVISVLAVWAVVVWIMVVAAEFRAVSLSWRSTVMIIKLLLTVWSIRLALLLFSLAAIVRLHRFGRRAEGDWKAVRAVWVSGCLLAVLHVVAVFGFVMNWSHQAAIEDTARQTQQLIGVSFGGGVYFNYVFLLVWTCDAAWWCGWPDRYLQRSRLWDLLVIGYLWFMAFNAAVVFETGAIRWLGLLATLIMAAVGLEALVARKRIR